MNIDTGADFKLIGVAALDASPAANEDEALKALSKKLTDKYGQTVVVQPHDIVVDGHKAVEVGYELVAVFGADTEQEAEVDMVGWDVSFISGAKEWAITITGRSEFRQELEGIHNQFLSAFHLLPAQ
jgi:hypothetical protein